MPDIEPGTAPSTATFALVVSRLRQDDDPAVLAMLTIELGKILDTANRTADAAREAIRRPEASETGRPSPCCEACSGIGRSVGICGDCFGAGRPR
jgi:hypothetical protein